jgi:gamma-glutamyl-gamma-aminobutyrate hydrolase PuuD
MKTYVVGNSVNYARFIENVELVDKIEDAELVIFTGGEDVTPRLYGCKKHATTYNNERRDKEEKKVFDSIRPDQLVLGICRGSQFLCVMNGGKLIQNCRNHAIGSTHAITNGNFIYQITSTHHQMQYPFDLPKENYDILYWAENLSYGQLEGDKIVPEVVERFGEPEIVLYHLKDKPKCLAVQGHPEMIPDSPVAKMINDLIKNNL